MRVSTSSLAGAAAALPPSRFSQRVHYAARVDSTNEEARRRGRCGEPDGALVIADEQTAGRGRRQRRWVSPPGAGLYASLLLRPELAAPESGAAVQLVAGIAVAEALEGFLQGGLELRWPNDCDCDGRKIAGVLVEAESGGRGEAAFDFLVCGVGINVNHGAEDFPGDLRDGATSIRLQVGHRVRRIDVLAALLGAFDEWEAVWRSRGLGPIRERWLELSPQTESGAVRVQTEARVIDGVAAGLSEDGRLRVRVGEELREIAVGELVRARPA